MNNVLLLACFAVTAVCTIVQRDGKVLNSGDANLPDEIDAFTDLVWNSLNKDNKVSLFVRFIDIESGKYETRIVNGNQ